MQHIKKLSKIIFCLPLCFSFICACSLTAQAEVFPLTLGGAIHEIDLNIYNEPELVLQADFKSSDTRALALISEALPGIKISASITAIEARNLRKRHNNRKARPWGLFFLLDNGKVGSSIDFNENILQAKRGIAYAQADPCNTKLGYRLEVRIDLNNFQRRANYKDNFMRVAAVLGPSADQQQTLFKFPSEKSSQHAVLLMKTNTSTPEFANIVDWSKGQPKNLKVFPIDQYFYSNQGIFTRLYLPAISLNGKKVSLEHLSSDFSYPYSVCASLAKKRQQLEGYQK